jgi:hypothetical protein
MMLFFTVPGCPRRYLSPFCSTSCPFGPSPCKRLSPLALDGRYSINYFGLG